MIPGNKASRQQPQTITGLNERQLHMHVVDFSRNHGGEAGALEELSREAPIHRGVVDDECGHHGAAGCAVSGAGSMPYT